VTNAHKQINNSTHSRVHGEKQSPSVTDE